MITMHPISPATLEFENFNFIRENKVVEFLINPYVPYLI